MRPGCPCREKKESSKNLRSRSFAEVQTQLGHLKLTPVKRFNNSCVTTAAKQPLSQLLCKNVCVCMMYVMYACDVDEADVCESDVDKVDGHDADDECDV